MAEHGPRRGAALTTLFAATILAVGCRTMARPGAALSSSPTGLGESDFATQRLYQVHGRREGADLRFRIALRIWNERAFDLAASDPFGRPLWRLAIAAGGGEWRDLRASRACRFDPASPIQVPGFTVPYAAGELPLLLLGRLPSAKTGDAARAHRAGGELHLVVADPPIELEWRESAHSPLPASAVPPSAPAANLPLCTDADFS